MAQIRNGEVTKYISVAFTPAEWRLVTMAAGKLGVKTTCLLRRLVEKGGLEDVMKMAEDPDVEFEGMDETAEEATARRNETPAEKSRKQKEKGMKRLGALDVGKKRD